ncbi:unnamed protein product [Brachionus calyciflorus]|uniref:Uncharacterized protein n=1 Tax=Brachionus calyciflorus TaxID=104777 RepID=A0A814L0S0_9BILA|nr:unnamed protein product [Brachionus calyciflorus]
MLIKLFPNVTSSTDIDKIIQECFVNSLLNQRLRGALRLKMFIMKNIKMDESLKINILIKYAECKNANNDSNYHSDREFSSSDSEPYSNQ